ncbi:adenosine receptor A1-like [Oncorhynchus tshawytscha]|uniref:G-protein coupled receptors family 1 profile domain-containing protein n=1 Tax=Oncorhynchus tshawytscha TaxID=74940 RepID=A0A8C8BXZ8_ONCTS|nr:adenosine receptor A1-like [Oncorhynchus tshawytscha]
MMYIALASVLGNVLVVLVVCTNRALRDTTFCFLVSLAVADIAVGALVIPLAVVISLGLKTQFYTCLFFSCLLLIITQGSILPRGQDSHQVQHYRDPEQSIVTQNRACWLLSALMGMVPMLGWHNEHTQGNLSITSDDIIVCKFTKVMRMDYMVYFNFFGWVVVPLTIMIALYAEIFRVIPKQLNMRAEATCDTSKYLDKKLKLAKSLALIVFLFALCWLPLHVMNCILFYCPECGMPKSAMYVGVFMTHINSALNPLVYAFRIQRFRAMLVQIFHCCMLCKPTENSPCPNQPSPPPLFEKTPVHPYPRPALIICFSCEMLCQRSSRSAIIRRLLLCNHHLG